MFAEHPLDSGGVDDGDCPKSAGEYSDIEHHILLTSMPVFGSKFAVQIKCHSKTLDRLRKEDGGGGGGGEQDKSSTEQFVDRS